MNKYLTLMLFLGFYVVAVGGRVEGRYLVNPEQSLARDVETIKALPGSISEGAQNVGEAVRDLAGAVAGEIKKRNVLPMLESYASRIRNNEISLSSGKEAAIQGGLSVASTDDVEALRSGIYDVLDKAAQVQGVDTEDLNVVLYNDADDERMGGHKDGVIAINLAHQDGSVETLNTVLGDELAHYIDYKKGRPSAFEAPVQQTNSRLQGDDAGEQSRRDGAAHANNPEQFKEQLDTVNFEDANAVVSEIEGLEPRTIVDEESLRVVATDKVNDGIVVLVSRDDADRLKIANQPEGSRVSGANTEILREVVIQPDEAVDGEHYDLNNPSDFERLAERTGNKYSVDDDDTFVFQNGMATDAEKAEYHRGLLESATGKSTGLIHNDTNGTVLDTFEYGRSSYSLHDVLTARVYEDMSKSGEQRIVVMHSAGNKDAKNAFDLLNWENRSLRNSIGVISVGSPISGEDIRNSASAAGAWYIGQSNHPKDPVTTGIISSTLTLGSRTTHHRIKKHHGFDSYLERGLPIGIKSPHQFSKPRRDFN